MPKTTDLTERIRQKQESDLQEIKTLQNEHAANMKQLYKDVLDTIENDTQDLKSLAKTKIRRSVTLLVPIWSLALIGVLICIASALYANHQYSKIQKQSAKLNSIPNLQVSTCGRKHPRTCVKVKPNVKPYGKNNQWRVIPK